MSRVHTCILHAHLTVVHVHVLYLAMFLYVYMSMCAHFILQQQEYDLVLEDQITFVMTETVAGNRSDMVSGHLYLCSSSLSVF